MTKTNLDWDAILLEWELCDNATFVCKKYQISIMSLYNQRNKLKYGGKSRQEIKELIVADRIKKKLSDNDGYIHINLKNADNVRHHFFADLLQRGWSMEKLHHHIFKTYYSVVSNRPFMNEYEELKNAIANRVKL